MIQTVINKSQNHSISKRDLLVQVTNKKDDSHDKYQVCCGHDLIEILSILLRKKIGSNNSNQVKQDELERSLRLAYETIHLRDTKLYSQVIQWQKENLILVFLE